MTAASAKTRKGPALTSSGPDTETSPKTKKSAKKSAAAPETASEPPVVELNVAIEEMTAEDLAALPTGEPVPFVAPEWLSENPFKMGEEAFAEPESAPESAEATADAANIKLTAVVLNAMARYAQLGYSTVGRAYLVEKLGITTDKISRPLAVLIGEGCIKKGTKAGSYEFVTAERPTKTRARRAKALIAIDGTRIDENCYALMKFLDASAGTTFAMKELASGLSPMPYGTVVSAINRCYDRKHITKTGVVGEGGYRYGIADEGTKLLKFFSQTELA